MKRSSVDWVFGVFFASSIGVFAADWQLGLHPTLSPFLFAIALVMTIITFMSFNRDKKAEVIGDKPE